MDLNKHLADYNSDEKHFHSSGFAKLANGNQIGSTNSSSFDKRRALNENRRVVMAYDRSALANTSYRDRARVVDDSNKNSSQNKARPSLSNNRANIVSQPAPRKYNPYA